MNSAKLRILKEKLNIDLDSEQVELFEKYEAVFLSKNAKVNLISKNDEKFLFEKHIFDSLALNLFLKPQGGQTLLDIGTGGGFPSIPLAILFSDLNIYPLDSIRKKVKIIEEIKDELALKNVFPICERAENLQEQYDFVTSRAVASLDKILQYAAPRLKKGGYFIAMKSKKIDEELKEAQKTIRRTGMKLVKTVEYTLPLEEVFERNLVVFKK